MDPKILPLLIFLVQILLTNSTQQPLLPPFEDTDQNYEQNINPHILPSHKVSYYDCQKPQNMRLYSTTKIEKCNIEEPDIETTPAITAVYQKEYIKEQDVHSCHAHYIWHQYYCNGYNVQENFNASPYETYIHISAKQCEEIANLWSKAEPDTEEIWYTLEVGKDSKKDYKIRFGKQGQYLETIFWNNNNMIESKYSCKTSGLGFQTTYQPIRYFVQATYGKYNN